MTREEARYYLQSSGFSEEQMDTIEQAFKQEPCDDVVRRQAVLDLFENYCGTAKICNYNQLFDDVKKLPSVRPQEPKTGHWIIDKGSLDALYGEVCKCSECGFESIGESDYCPNCGCAMKGE